jgi:hypothetical protein
MSADVQEEFEGDVEISEELKDSYPSSASSANVESTEESRFKQIEFTFGLFSNTPDPKYSRTIEIYDSVPKYVTTEKTSTDLQNAEIVHVTSMNKQVYKTVIKPAIMRGKNGKSVLMYPGERENMVELALRKLAVDGNVSNMKDQVGVVFTLGELQQELISVGRHYNLNEIKESIFICRGASLEIYNETEGEQEQILSSSFFPTVGLHARKDWLKNPGNSRCFVVFNPLVTDSISKFAFRLINYRTHMQIKSHLGRYIHTRLSMVWKQASPNDPYDIYMNAFLVASGRGLSPRNSENIRAMKNALDALAEQHDIIDYYTMAKIKDGNKVVDVHFRLYPHKKFVDDTITANKDSRSTQLKVLSKGLGNEESNRSPRAKRRIKDLN